MSRPSHTDTPQHHQVPEIEHESSRLPDFGYEGPAEAGFIRCLAHGFPTPLARWHCHDEYELHLITATSGKAYIGDWIGPFEAGHLVLVGPRLPHNWVSFNVPEGGVPLRDLVIQFPHDPIAQTCQQVAELSPMQSVLERARGGIEFFGLSKQAQRWFERVMAARGLQRFAVFCELMDALIRCPDYRLLSTAHIQACDGNTLDSINAIIRRITENLAEAPSFAQLADKLGMTESAFSRFFNRATGNTYTDFVNQVRINRACQLLQQSGRNIIDICHDVGFHNVSNFNRRFLELTGTTPSEYRRQAARRPEVPLHGGRSVDWRRHDLQRSARGVDPAPVKGPFLADPM